MDEKMTPEEMLAQVNTAITTVLCGGQSYKIGSQSLTRADLAMLKSMRDDLEAQLANEESGPPAGAHICGVFRWAMMGTGQKESARWGRS